MIAPILALALQLAAPMGPPRTTTISPATWTCQIRDQSGRHYAVRGSFGEIPPASTLPKGRILDDPSGTFVVGEHEGGLLNRGRTVRFYNMAVAGRPPEGGGRNYYHFFFRLYPGQPGVVMIEQQLIDREPEIFRGFGAGTCQSRFEVSQGEPR